MVQRYRRLAAGSADVDDADFWKEIKAIKREYHKDVDKAVDPSRWISFYEHSNRSVDEFFAEAFTHAKMKQMGIPIPDKYGIDFTYSNRVLTVTDKYFKKTSVDKINRNAIIISNKQYFNLESKDFETIFLPKKEYSHVMHELNTNLSNTQRMKK